MNVLPKITATGAAFWRVRTQSPVAKVVRLDSLNYFNYTTIITMFDVVSIMDGTTVFIREFAILAEMGLIGIIAGSLKLTKKDMPL